jgi:hypothetical protein
MELIPITPKIKLLNVQAEAKSVVVRIANFCMPLPLMILVLQLHAPLVEWA